MFQRGVIAALGLAMLGAAPLWADVELRFAELDALSDVQRVDRPNPSEDADADPQALPEPGFFEEWELSLSAGVTGTEGNTRSQAFNFQFRADKETPRHRWLWDNKYFFNRSEGERTQNEAHSRLTKDWLIPSRQWFLFARAIYTFDEFRAWDHRGSLFGGAGYDFVRTDDLAITGRLGAGVTRTWVNVHETTPEGLIGLELLRWRITENQRLTASSTLYPNLEDLPRNRVVSNIEWTISMAQVDGLSLKFGAEHEYESRTVGDVDHHDLTYYGALQYDF